MRGQETLAQEITDLNQKRQEFIATALKTGGQNTDRAFDAAMLRAIRAQATARQFRFE